MSTIRVVWGGATGPTEMAAYDAALAAAGIADYNLVTVSSVVPAEAELAVVGEAPDLGATGNRLTVVQSRADRPPGADEPAVAGLGWARSRSGRGLFYEATGASAFAVRTEIEEGLAAGRALRDWTFQTEEVLVRQTAPEPDSHTTQVVCATYGQSEPLL
jgi:arginine decarboxylase